jgi:hypothetical protein
MKRLLAGCRRLFSALVLAPGLSFVSASMVCVAALPGETLGATHVTRRVSFPDPDALTFRDEREAEGGGPAPRPCLLAAGFSFCRTPLIPIKVTALPAVVQ